MEKCGCKQCIRVLGRKAIHVDEYIVENCPCRNCLVKVVCDLVCKDVVEHCRSFDKAFERASDEN